MESLLTAIRDATSLREALEYDFPETFDIASALSLWLEHGWRPSYPGVEFICEVPPESILVHGDPDRLRQMLEKLIDNAVSFHAAETPVSLQLSAGQDSLELRISNEGNPIAPDMLGHIFNSMVSLRTQKETTPHLGLGLYIVRTIIEHHHGTIRAENLSDGRTGVCFIVSLPRQTKTLNHPQNNEKTNLDEGYGPAPTCRSFPKQNASDP